MENYYSWKNENKVGQFESVIDMFLQEGMRIDLYFDSYITGCT